MGAIDYVRTLRAVTSLLKRAPSLEGVFISNEIEPVTVDQCPAVIVAVSGFTKEVIQIVGMQSGPNIGPHEVRVSISAECWAFSAQGVGDVMRQVSELTSKVEDVLITDPGFSGTCDLGGVAAGQMRYEGGAGGGLYACCQLRIDAVSVAV